MEETSTFLGQIFPEHVSHHQIVIAIVEEIAVIDDIVICPDIETRGIEIGAQATREIGSKIHGRHLQTSDPLVLLTPHIVRRIPRMVNTTEC